MNKNFVNENTKWKYMRDDSIKSIDLRRHTKLSDYLSVIFPNKEFVYDSLIPKDIQMNRGSEKYKRYKPDARCEKLSLVIECDGYDHFLNYEKIIKDNEKDSYLKSLGYKVVRIPYFIQLSNENIKYLFGVDVNETMCELIYSFSDISSSESLVCVGGMSEAGREKFIDIFKKLPKNTKQIIYDDILHCINLHSEIKSSWICPNYILDILKENL